MIENNNNNSQKKFTQISLKKSTKNELDEVRLQLKNKLSFKITSDHVIDYALHYIQKDDGEDFKKWIANKYINFYKELL